MTANVTNWQWRCLASAAVLLLLATAAVGGRGPRRPAKIGDYNPADQTVEMFAAIEKGDIAVKLIPKDSTQCRRADREQDRQAAERETARGLRRRARVGSTGRRRRRRRPQPVEHQRQQQPIKAWAAAWAAWGRRHGRRHGHVQCPARKSRTTESHHRLPRTRQARAPRRRSPMKSSRWKASPPSRASANCANCSAAARSTSGPLRPPPGT